ncbi:MAG TPA: carbonic anhydrase family protein [Chloroflexia bacterium]|nr:carbonic anhydrase family protein [Chloroflexia bacterium]
MSDYGDFDDLSIFGLPGVAAAGHEQSPINIKRANQDEALEDLRLAYKDSFYRALNDGYTVRVEYDQGSFIIFQGQRYELQQFHFHSPAEHRINGQIFPMCIHLVHANHAGELLVVGIKFAEGAENPFLAKFWDRLPVGTWHVQGNFKLNAGELFPANLHYFTYKGSLTTPPYTEGVTWVILKQALEVSRSQVQKFKAIVGQNARSIQPLNDRLVREH